MMTFLSVFSRPIFKGELAVKVWGRVKQYLGPPEETHGTTPKKSSSYTVETNHPFFLQSIRHLEVHGPR